MNETPLVRRLKSAGPYFGLVVLNVVFRLPALLNAANVHSDAAIVGLQAMHILRGETSRFLWGAGYQSAFDADVAAAFFALMGPRPIALMLAPFFGHLLMTFAVYFALSRALTPLRAFLLSLAIVFTPLPINAVVTYAPRQWCITAMIFGVALLAAFPASRWTPVRNAIAMMLGCISLALDLFGLQLFPSLVVLMLFVSLDAPRSLKNISVRVVGGLLGLGVGYGVFKWLRTGPEASSGPDKTALDFHRFDFNFKLLTETCLPWTLGAKVWVPGKNLYPDQFQPGELLKIFQTFGGWSFLVLALIGLPLLLTRRLDWPQKRLSLYGLSVIAAALGGFLVSSQPTDMWSSRYLAPIIWAAPFALIPLAAALRPQGFAVIVAPYLAVAALGGWLSYGPAIDGPLPVRTPRGTAVEETQVADLLRQHGVEAVAAQYWLSYRLSFLWEENPIAVPINPGEDRYAPHMQRFNAARVVAYVFHPSEPRASAEQVLPYLNQAPGSVEQYRVADFTILIYQRRAAP